MIPKPKKALATTMLLAILAVAFVSLASVQAVTVTFTATATDTSSVITLSGSGFDPSENVTLAMLNQTDSSVIYAFTENVTTDEEGAFSANVTLPPGIYGTYDITAETSTVSESTEYTIDDVTAVTASPDNSNIIAVTGSGFNADENITLQLNSTDITVHTFEDTITTDTAGNFNATVIVPTSLSGTYTLIASTSTTSANTTITVPDLTGPTGATGSTGQIGATGATGAAGDDADQTTLYLALVLSIAAIAVAAVTVIKKR